MTLVMSREYSHVTGKANQRSDLYALGCVLHEMLTGQRLFTASTPFAVASKQATERPVNVREVCPEIPGGLSDVVSALLEKHPEDRPADAVEVYGRLVGFVDGPESIPGVLQPASTPNPHLMYGRALSRVVRHDPGAEVGGNAAGESGAVVGDSVPGETPREEHLPVHEAPAAEEARRDQGSRLRREDLHRARTRAADLLGSARYRQAAATLSEATERAASEFGPIDPEVVELRLDRANALFEGGNFRQAGPLYAELAEDLTRDAQPQNQSLIFRCRLQDATCLAMGGREDPALNSLDSLLRDEVVAYGPDDHRPLELRRQVGVLQLTLGRLEEGTQTLRALRTDLVRLHGAEHPEVTLVDGLLKEAASSG